MAEAIDADEILEKLGRKRERILLAIYRHGELRSREIREQTDLPRGSKNHHYDTLQGWELIEIVDYDEKSGGYPERVFDLTDKGRKFVEDYLTEGRERPDSYEMRIERLEDDVDDLQTQNDRLEDEVAELREDLDALESKHLGLIDALEETDLFD